jgi:hypothetical protein
MADVVVTLPKQFGIDSWYAEGDRPGDPWSGTYYGFTVSGIPDVERGDRVYVVYDGEIIGYAPLVKVGVMSSGPPSRKRTELIRGGGAVACTIPERIPGFRGYRYRWWDREDEVAA